LLTHFFENVSLRLGEDGKRSGQKEQEKGLRIVFDTNAIIKAILPQKSNPGPISGNGFGCLP